MKIGFNMPQLTSHASQKAVHEFAITADNMRYDSLWVQDHFLYPENPNQSHPVHQFTFGPDPVRQWPEGYESVLAPLEALAYVAGATKNIRLGTSILVFGYHRPVTLAKQVATIDKLSCGRFDLGLGLGWATEEFAHMDTPFEKRGARCTDFIRAMRAAWQDNPTGYEGPYYNFPKGSTSPKPNQKDWNGNPGVPITGAFLNDAGFDRVAELCDSWHPAGHPPELAMMRLAQINQIAAEKYGREPMKCKLRVFAAPLLPGIKEIGPQLMQPNWSGTIDDMMPHLKAAKDAGCEEVVLDCSFMPEITSEDHWLSQPEFFRPLLEEAKS
ncbi:MAG: TIGR03619 family F420-dependent LLM class oxidoreductase [Proteobacteria bacterium]|nr:TIGR03619 family F420-dependent LLM class oxidoreductase [Pseudomonadota bacterium]